MKVGKPGLAAAALGAASLFGTYRRWQLIWGASREEVDRTMPGDELVPGPTFNATRAVSILASPEAVWPWIVQIGFGRAGWYSYDILDNLGRRSAERLIPELQHLRVGDLVPLGPGESSGMRVKEFEVGSWVVWWDAKLRLTSWTWQLTPMPDGTTRLVTRVRSRSAWRHPSTMVWRALAELADFPMMRRCLLGIKRRAEAVYTPERESPPGEGVPDRGRPDDKVGAAERHAARGASDCARTVSTAPVMVPSRFDRPD